MILLPNIRFEKQQNINDLACDMFDQKLSLPPVTGGDCGAVTEAY